MMRYILYDAQYVPHGNLRQLFYSPEKSNTQAQAQSRLRARIIAGIQNQITATSAASSRLLISCTRRLRMAAKSPSR